jgi:FMN phosphatase YigB (HAD superfamily)
VAGVPAPNRSEEDTVTAGVALPDGVDTVLLDVGGVLYVDPWETLLLTPDVGLADRLGIPTGTAETVARSLWVEFAVRAAGESEYWARFGSAAGATVDLDLVAEVSDLLLRPTPEAQRWLAAADGLRIGVATDNTSFWFARQRDDLGLDAVLSPELTFTSFDVGRRKQDRPGLLDVAAEVCTPSRTAFVDDREHNRARARALGFRVVEAPAPTEPA